MRTVNTNQHARRQLHVTLWQSRMLKKLLAVYRLVLPSSAKWWENKERQKHTARQSRRKNREPKKAARTNENPRKRHHSQQKTKSSMRNQPSSHWKGTQTKELAQNPYNTGRGLRYEQTMNLKWTLSVSERTLSKNSSEHLHVFTAVKLTALGSN